jgi:integration host factor subunit beta
MLRSDLMNNLIKSNPALVRSSVDAAVKEILDHLSETLATGGRIEIRGFGSFSRRHHAPRQGRNPKTGERVDVDHPYRVHFKPGLALRARVNGADSILG